MHWAKHQSEEQTKDWGGVCVVENLGLVPISIML